MINSELQAMENDSLDVDEENVDGLPWPVKLLFVAAAAALLVVLVVVCLSFEPESQQDSQIAAFELERDPGAGDDHRYLRFVFDKPAVTEPTMLPLTKEDRRSVKPVVGIVVGEFAQAFILHQAQDKDVTLISTLIGGKPIAISHNYLLDKTRVMTAEGTDQRIPIRLGGQEDTMEFVVLYKNARFNQESEHLPLDDYPFEIMTLNQWSKQHPDTLVCHDDVNYKFGD